jgi:hypothetical protein
MEIGETLVTIDSLVARSEKGEFVEPELFPLVYELIENPSSVPEEKLSVTEDLFQRIAAMDKSTCHGCGFYQKLRESSLPFVHRVFDRAVYTEPYYNCQPEVLFGYLATTLQKIGYENEGVLDFLDPLNGDLGKYSGQPLDLALLPREDSTHIQLALNHFLDQGGHHATWSGLVASIVFPFPNILSGIVSRLKKEIGEFEEAMNGSQEQKKWYVFSCPGMMARALYCVYGREEYEEMSKILESCSDYNHYMERWDKNKERIKELAANLPEKL